MITIVRRNYSLVESIVTNELLSITIDMKNSFSPSTTTTEMFLLKNYLNLSLLHNTTQWNGGWAIQFFVVTEMCTMVMISARQSPWCCDEIVFHRVHFVAAMRHYYNLRMYKQKTVSWSFCVVPMWTLLLYRMWRRARHVEISLLYVWGGQLKFYVCGRYWSNYVNPLGTI